MKRQLVIDNHTISDTSECFVIAEIGHNHQGDMDICKKMFVRAKECGADAVKLQKRDNRSLYTAEMYAKPYDNENSYGATYGAHREALEFSKEQFLELKAYAKEIGLVFFSTVFDLPSADLCEEVGIPAYKIASGDLRNTPLLEHVAHFQKPIILSTGGGSMEDVERAVAAITPINPRLCLLQCTAGYPVEPDHMDLRVISTYRERFPDAVVGLSSHDNGIVMPVAAFMLGARVVEKHFTLNHTWKGTDHAFSLEPEGFRKLVRDLRRVKAALGDGIKKKYPCEKNPMVKMGKQLVAARELPAGTSITRADVSIKSPGGGLQPYELEKLLGRKLKRSLKADESFALDALE